MVQLMLKDVTLYLMDWRWHIDPLGELNELYDRIICC